jgi:putative membrane protein insertion efficiency factor
VSGKSAIAQIPRRAVIGAIRAYQVLISPLFGPTCRFRPTCSAYAITSVERFGALRGGWLAAKRIGRCHPWNPGGFDPVPDSLPVKRSHTEGHDADRASAGDS